MSQSTPADGDASPDAGHAAEGPGGEARPLSDMSQDDAAVAWAMVEASPDALVMVDESGVIELVNRQTESLFGHDRGELLGRRVEVLLPERFTEVHRAHRSRYGSAPGVRAMGGDLELQARRADGSEFPVEVSLSPVELQGELHIIAAVRDSTPRIVAAAEAARLRRGVDGLADGVFMFDADTLELSYANEGAARQTGHSVAELLDGMTALRFAATFTRENLAELMAPLLAGETDVLQFEATLVPQSGVAFPVDIAMESATEEGDDRRVVIAVVRDISERVEAERWAHMIQHSIDSVSDAVFICDEKTLEFIHVNQGAVNLHGYSREELLDSMTPVDLAPDLDQAELTGLLESLATDPDRTARLETASRGKDGTRVPVQVDVNWPRPPAPDASRPIVAVVRDISAETAAAARQQQLQSLAAGVSRVRLAMLSGSTRAEGLRLICRSARETLDAATALILTPIGDGPTLQIEASSGIAEEVKDQLSQLRFTADVGLIGSVFSSGQPMVTDRPHDHPGTPEPTHAVLNEFGVGSLIIAPLAGDGEVAGVLVVTRSDDDKAFTESDLDPVGHFTVGAAAAIVLAQARESRAMLELLEDRERIGREMHDKVIGNLFATGLGIQATAARIDDAEVQRRMAAHVLEIDEAIKDIRTSIYGLRSQLGWGKGIKGEILAIAAEHEPVLGREPTVSFSGLVDTLPQPIVDELRTALRAALTDASQREGVTEVRVSVVFVVDRVEMTVAADGESATVGWNLPLG